jgi:endonuclease/exonuclease/phosphatase family metal-dependent hydrolase
MLASLKSLLNGWDRTFLDLSSKMAEPFCAAWHLFRFRLVAPLDPQKFENSATVASEVVTRILIGLGGALGTILTYSAPIPVGCSVLVLGIGSKVFRAIGFALQKGGYTHVRGAAAEKPLDPRNPRVKVMNWNICGIGGGLSLDHGGVIHWRSRLGAIVAKIKAEDPDVLILQEVYDTALAEALVDQLKSDYAHFFMHLGPNVLGSVGGGMVISKCAVHDFSHTSFKNNRWTLNRGFASLELKASPQETLPCARVIGTHFIHGDEPGDQKNRMEQLAQIVGYLKRRIFAMPTVLAGDLNIERDEKEGKILSSYFHHGYQGLFPTCTNRLTAQWDSKARSVWGETIDYISLFKSSVPGSGQLPVVDRGVILENCHLVEAFDASYNTKTALSDHHGLSCVVKGLRRARVSA